MKEIEGHPLLWHVLKRIAYSEVIDKIVLATSEKKQDSVLFELAKDMGFEAITGSEDDVLDRFYKVAVKYEPDVIVRLTADCPIIEPTMIDQIIKFYIKHKDKFDYVHRGDYYPEGVAEVEVFSYEILEKIWEEAEKKSDREHVTSYIWSHPDKFKIGEVNYNENLEDIRLEVDEFNDLKVVRKIYNALYQQGEIFHWAAVHEFLKNHPEIMVINKYIERNEGYQISLEND